MVKEEKDASDSGWQKTILKDFEEAVGKGSGAATPKKRRLREIPEHYFIPRRSLSYNLLFYGAAIAGGIGAGMLVEVWMNKKVKEGGGVVWEFDK